MRNTSIIPQLSSLRQHPDSAQIASLLQIVADIDKLSLGIRICLLCLISIFVQMIDYRPRRAMPDVTIRLQRDEIAGRRIDTDHQPGMSGATIRLVD